MKEEFSSQEKLLSLGIYRDMDEKRKDFTGIEDIAKITGGKMVIKNWMMKKPKSSKKKKSTELNKERILSKITEISRTEEDEI